MAFALLGGLALGLAGCSASDSGAANTVVVSGSTTVLPIAEEAAEMFGDLHPGVDVLVSGMGSSAGIEAASSGTADIGTSSRDLKEEEEGLGLAATVIAHDGIAVIVNPDNPISAITAGQLKAIFLGTITNWSELGGPDLPIVLINRDEASGTREAFSKIVMDKEPFDIGAVVLPGTGQVREVVARTPGAIGYISVGFVAPRFIKTEVKALTLDGVEPTEAHVADGSYLISRNLYFFTKGTPSPMAQRYIDFVLSDAVQNGPVVEAGFVPAKTAAGGE